MFIACPHCRYLVATDPRGQHAPAHCPRCGSALGEAGARDDGRATEGTPVDGGPSLARLLRRDEVAAAPATDVTGEATMITTTATPVEPGTVESRSSSARPAEDDAVDTEAAASLAEAESSESSGPSESSADAITEPGAVEPSIAAAPAAQASARPASRAPSFLHGQAPARAPSRIPRWQWATLIVLAVVLVLQVLLADRARLSADAGWRPVLASLCNALGCSLPPWREPQAFAMLDRDVRPVPGAPGVLLAQATFRNDARWAQSWPVLTLTLKDADGRTLGARALRPAEYLPRDSAAQATIGPGQSAQVAVRVREPSANVVAFSFDFH
ncbi:DUF3426 domain-containing protein [Pseudomonas sp. R2.Fl]|nr:DUF3426 domain-containing protein [Pseudomonas sp. R2.Fl]